MRTLSCLAVRPLSLLLFGKKLSDDLSFGINHSVPELSPHPLRSTPTPPPSKPSRGGLRGGLQSLLQKETLAVFALLDFHRAASEERRMALLEDQLIGVQY